MISRVSVGVSFGWPSIGTRPPRTRSIGGAPAVIWRSDALFLTTARRISAKSRLTSLYIGSERRHLKGLARAGDASDLGDRGEPAAHLLEPVLAQPHHALVDRRVGDRLRGLACHRQGADRVRDPHDLVEADPALVARAAAAGAAHGLVG